MQILAGGDGGELGSVDPRRRVTNSEIGATDVKLALVWELRLEGPYVEMVLGSVFPVINFSQASAHSRITSMAYLQSEFCESQVRYNGSGRCTSYFCTRRRMRTDSRAFHRESYKCGTTRWWRGEGQEGDVRHPQCLALS